MKVKDFDFKIWSYRAKQYYQPRIEFLIVSENHINEDITINDAYSELLCIFMLITESVESVKFTTRSKK